MEKGIRAEKTLACTCEEHLPAGSYPLRQSKTPGKTETPGLLLPEMPEALHTISPIIGRTLQRHLFVEDYMNGYPLGELMHPAVVVEVPGPVVGLKQRQDLRGDAAGKIEPTRSHELQHQAGGLRREIADKEIHGLGADEVFMPQRGFADHRSRVLVTHPSGEPFRHLPPGRQTMKDVFDTHPRNQPLPAHMPELLLQGIKKLHVLAGPRRKIAVPPFRGKRMITLAVKEQSGFAKAGTRRDDGEITPRIRRTRLQRDQLVLAQPRQPIGRRLE